jgi:hypothetical protein
MKAIRIFLLVLIIIGITAVATQKLWVPVLVQKIITAEGVPTPLPVTWITPQHPAASSIVLNKDGLGIVHFGDSPETVIAAVTKTLGAPTKDTGMTSSFSKYGTCPGNELRGVEWNNFYVLFGDTAFGTQKFFQYGYTDTKEAHLVPALMTSKGVTIGMTVQEIKAKYPSAKIGTWLPGQDAITLEARSTDKKEYLGGTIIDSKLYWLAGGILCGE